MLSWTGHALVDVGVAGLCAMSGKAKPEDLTLEDLDAAGREMERRYFDPYYSAYLSCVFMNSEFVQPGEGEKKGESRKRYVQRVLFGHRHSGDAEATGKRCAFSGEPATHLIHRSQMPLMTGSEVLNFFPNLQGALAIAGPYLVAVQTIPLAGRRCEGRLLIVHGDDAAMTLAFAGRNWRANQKFFNLATTNQLPAEDQAIEGAISTWDKKKGAAKYADAKAPATLLIADLEETLAEMRQRGKRVRGGVTAYWMSNSGQGPSLRVFALPGTLVAFLEGVHKGEFHAPWQRIVQRGWPAPERKATKKEKKSLPALPGVVRNQVHQDLLEVFPEDGSVDLNEARRFLTVHILGGRREARDAMLKGGDPPGIWMSRGALKERGGEWSIAEKFLTEVVGMAEDRVSCLKELGDRIAGEIQRRNDKRLLRRILLVKRFDDLVDVLRKAQHSANPAEGEPLFLRFDDLVKAFEIDENLGAPNWRLGRALLAIRIVEKLIELKAMDKDLLPEAAEDEDDETEAKAE